jgi:hypothetical protein
VYAQGDSEGNSVMGPDRHLITSQNRATAWGRGLKESVPSLTPDCLTATALEAHYYPRNIVIKGPARDLIRPGHLSGRNLGSVAKRSARRAPAVPTSVRDH